MAIKKKTAGAETDALVQAGNEVVKAKGKPRGGNSPVIGDNGLHLDEGDNKKYLSVSLKMFNMSKIDLHDPVAVQERLGEFFAIHEQADLKPTVTGMAMSLGLDRRRLWEIRTGNVRNDYPELRNLPHETQDTIKKAYEILETLWENYMSNGKINPVSGIFLGKNNFGYQDKTEYVLTPNQNQEQNFDADSIRQRYLEDSQNSTTDDSND